MNICWERYGDLLDRTINWFNTYGKKYRVAPWKHDFILKYSKGVALDLGCGYASTTRYLLDKGYLKKLILVDLAENMLRMIRSRDHRVLKIYGDLLENFLKEDSFDTIYLLAVLHHIPGVECRLNILSSIRRMLKPDGYLILTTWSPEKQFIERNNKWLRLGDKEYLFRDKHGVRYYYIFDLDELTAMLEETGFRIVESGIFVQNPSRKKITQNIYLVSTKRNN